MEGKDTELDKTILEAIKDPLTHIVRNSVDHGIETPEVRAAGKPAEGCSGCAPSTKAARSTSRSPTTARHRRRARQGEGVEKGLITREQASRMSEREAQQLIFLPGFSTAAAVTNVSGRGVGMDVVKTNIEKIGGQVDMQNVFGAGHDAPHQDPADARDHPGAGRDHGGERFAIPQVSLLELVRLEGDAPARHRDPSGRRSTGCAAPAAARRPDAASSGSRGCPIPGGRRPQHRRAAGRRAAVRPVVDRINDTEEIVVKPLSKQLKGLPVYAGATIMGDGRVALILDVIGIAQRAARLEEIPVEEIENSGDYHVTQYRDRIMPLVWLGRAKVRPGANAGEPGERLQVIVHSSGDQHVGLVVDRIQDIVDARIQVERTTHRHDTLGSAVVQGRVTDLLDVAGIVHRAIPALPRTPSPPAKGQMP
jgi:two-component system chemotaxis sensor kinase CheA